MHATISPPSDRYGFRAAEETGPGVRDAARRRPRDATLCTQHLAEAGRDRGPGIADGEEVREGGCGAADGVAAPKACEGDATSLCRERRKSMSGTNDRDDMSGEGAVQPGESPWLRFCSGGLP